MCDCHNNRLCSLVLDWGGWLWEFGVLQVKSPFQQYLLLSHLSLRVFMITYSTSGWAGCCLLGLFSPHQGFLCQSSVLWICWWTFPPLFCCTVLSCRDCWCSSFRLGPSTRRNLALKNPLLTTFKIWSVNQKHIAKNTPSASRANSNKE